MPATMVTAATMVVTPFSLRALQPLKPIFTRCYKRKPL